MRTHRPDQGSAEPWQCTARPGLGQWPAMDTAVLGQAVGALNAAEQWRAQSTRARQEAAGLVQGAGLTMDWSDAGNGTGTRATVWGWPALVTAAVAQGDKARQTLSSEGEGKAFGTATEDEASPLPLTKALKGSRRATGLISLY